MTAFKSFQQMQDISLTDHSRFYESPLRDPNQLKNMTLDDYLNHAFMSNSEKADYLRQLKKEGLDYTLEDNAYDVLRNRKDMNRWGQGKQIKIDLFALSPSVILYAFNRDLGNPPTR